MKWLYNTFFKVYASLLGLYPKSFRNEFQDQMLLDFSDMEKDARSRGKFALIKFYAYELFEFPINLLQAYLKEWNMLQKFSSEPLNTAWRSAVAFGIAYGVGVWLNSLVFWVEVVIKNTPATHPQFVFERFLLNLLSIILTGVIFGAVLAFLFAPRRSFFYYLIIGALGWFLQVSIVSVVEYFFDMSIFYNDRLERVFLQTVKDILRVSILGSILLIVQSESRRLINVFSLYAISYPLLVYLAYLFIVRNNFIGTGLFIFQVIFWVTLLGGVFVLATKYDPEKKMITFVVGGYIGYIVITNILLMVLSFTRLMPPMPSEGFAYENPLFWYVIELMFVFNTIIGCSLGFILGLIWGSKNAENTRLVTV